MNRTVTVQPETACSSTTAPATSAAVTAAGCSRYLASVPVRSQATTGTAGSRAPGARPLSCAHVIVGTAYCIAAGSAATSSGRSVPNGASAGSADAGTWPGSVRSRAAGYAAPSLASTAGGTLAAAALGVSTCGVVGLATTARKLSRPGCASSRRPSASPPATVTVTVCGPVTLTRGRG